MTGGKYFWIKSQLNGMAVDISGGNVVAGSEVLMWSHHGEDNQVWCEDPDHHVIRSKIDSNMVLERMDDGSVKLGVMEPGKETQQWMLLGNRLGMVSNPDLCLTIRDDSDADGATIFATAFADKPSQQWEFVYLEKPSYCFILSALSGKALDIEAGDLNPGARIILWDKHGAENQQWYEDKHGVIRSRLTGFAIDLSDGTARTRDIADDDGSKMWRWRKEENCIRNMEDANMCLEVKDANPENLAEVQAAEYASLDHQNWFFEYL